MEKVGAIVLAAGKGSRMKSDVQKQYMSLCGKPVIYYSLKAFQDALEVTDIVLVAGKDEIDFCREEIVEKYHFDKVKAIVAGGKERYHSVYSGLCALSDMDFVMIHDGARPMLDHDIIKRNLECVKIENACVTAVPSKDTIKIANDEDYAIDTPNRQYLWNIQTPQTFSYPVIKSAYEKIIENEDAAITDDAMVVEKIYKKNVKLIMGSYKNIKITTPEDLLIATVFVCER